MLSNALFPQVEMYNVQVTNRVSTVSYTVLSSQGSAVDEDVRKPWTAKHLRANTVIFGPQLEAGFCCGRRLKLLCGSWMSRCNDRPEPFIPIK